MVEHRSAQCTGQVMAAHGRAIVMEDDVVTARGFLDYMNAALDALSDLGITELPMPATPERVWRAIRAASGAGP